MSGWETDQERSRRSQVVQGCILICPVSLLKLLPKKGGPVEARSQIQGLEMVVSAQAAGT